MEMIKIINDILNFLMGIVNIGTLLFLIFGIPNVIRDYLSNRYKKEIENELADKSKEFEKELEKLKEKFQIEYQKAEQEFTLKIDDLKKERTILPKVYKEILIAIAYYEQTNSEDLEKYAELKNFLTFNKFYINKQIFLTAKNIEKKLSCFIVNRMQLKKVQPDKIKDLTNREEDLKKQIDKLVDDLENMIEETLN